MQEPPSPLLPPRCFPMNVTVTRDAICKEKEKEREKKKKKVNSVKFNYLRSGA